MDRIFSFYFALPNDNAFGIITKAFNRLVAKAIKIYFDLNFISYLDSNRDKYTLSLNTEKRDCKVIVSLTTYPARINEVWIVIECMFRQLYRPDKVILWLSKPQFEGIDLPDRLKTLEKRGLEICFVEDDLRSHKKYFYAVQQYPNDIIITVDDDVYYPKNIVSTLVSYHEKNSDCIISNRGHKITTDALNGKILPYKLWKKNIKKNKSSFFLVPTGVGGVLYPPNSLSQRIFDADLLKKLCFLADDLWLKVGSLLMNKKVIVTGVFSQTFIAIGKTQKTNLHTLNSKQGNNNNQFRNILDYFELGNMEKFRKG